MQRDARTEADPRCATAALAASRSAPRVGSAGPAMVEAKEDSAGAKDEDEDKDEMDDEQMANYWGPQDDDVALVPDEGGGCSDKSLEGSANVGGELATELAPAGRVGQGSSEESAADLFDLGPDTVAEELEDDIKVSRNICEPLGQVLLRHDGERSSHPLHRCRAVRKAEGT